MLARACLFTTFLLAMVSAVSAAAPPNDNFINALVLTGTSITVTNATNLEATKEVGEPNHAGNIGGKSVWWKWTAPGAGSVIIRTTGSTFDTLLAAYSGSSIPTLGNTLMDQNDDNGVEKTSLIVFNVTAGTTYRIVVDGFFQEGTAAGSIKLNLEYRTTLLPKDPLNNQFANRIPLQGASVSAVGANYKASKEPREPDHAGELGGASVWWSWKAPASGSVTIATAGSNFDTLLGVYTGSALTNLSEVKFDLNLDEDVSTNDPTSLVSFQAVKGTEYQIAVDGYFAQPGDIELHITMVSLSLPKPLATGGYSLTLSGIPGQRYTLLGSTNLLKWEAITTRSNVTGTVEFPDAEAAKLPRRFYRAREGD
jgi:hypothetical protein